MVKPQNTVLFRTRTSLGMSRAELSRRAGISRQALSAIELGKYQPGVTIALRLARELGQSVERLFSEDTTCAGIELNATWLGKGNGSQRRVALARIGGRVVAVPQPSALLSYLPAAGIVERMEGKEVTISTFRSWAEIDETLLFAGSDPAVTILIEWMARSGSQVGVVPLQLSGNIALGTLADGSAHVAGVCLRDPANGEFNFRRMRDVLGDLHVLVVHFAKWEIGLVASEIRLKGIKEISELFPSRMRVVNRERGSRARQILDVAIAEAKICPTEVAGYENEVGGPLEVAAAVAMGHAEAGIATRMAAEAYGLKFLALQEEYYDLVIPRRDLGIAPIDRMLNIINSRRFAREIAQMCAYNTEFMGKELAE